MRWLLRRFPLPVVERLYPLRAGVEVGLGDDRVPAVDALRLVADHRHRRRARHARALKVPHRGPAEVVRDATGALGVLARRQPHAAHWCGHGQEVLPIPGEDGK